MTIALIIALVFGMAAGVALGALVWRAPLNAVKESRDFARHDLARFRREVAEEIGDARVRARDAERERIVLALHLIPGLRCSDRDPHLRLSEVNAVVCDEPVVVKRRKVPTAVRVGQNANGATGITGNGLVEPDPLAAREGFATGEGEE